jgi:selenocysteine-specific elongation factor
MARVRLLGQDKLPPGQSGWAQLRLREQVSLVKGDRFIVRIPSPPATVGGGIVVDPNPGRKHRRFRPEVIARLETLSQGTPAEILLQALERRGPTSARELLSASQVSDASQALAQLLKEGQAVLLDTPRDIRELSASNGLLAARGWWSSLMDRISNELSAYHRQLPLRTGMPREALRSGLKLQAKVFNAVMARAAAEEQVADEGATVRLPSHTVTLNDDQQRRVDALLGDFHRQPFTTPSVKDSVAAVGEEVLGVLIDRGDLVQASPDVLFLPETYEDMVSRVRAFIQREGSITLAQARDLFETSRKYAQALLEHLDEIGVTKRIGDKRVLR